jgi:hypothetical protein
MRTSYAVGMCRILTCNIARFSSSKMSDSEDSRDFASEDSGLVSGLCSDRSSHDMDVPTASFLSAHREWLQRILARRSSWSERNAVVTSDRSSDPQCDSYIDRIPSCTMKEQLNYMLRMDLIDEQLEVNEHLARDRISKLERCLSNLPHIMTELDGELRVDAR